MIEALALRFVIRTADADVRELNVDAETARIGSGPHCEIRLDPEDAAVEHVHVTVRAGAAYAESRDVQPRALLDGRPFTQGPLLPESVLGLGRVEVRVSVVARYEMHGMRRGPTVASRRALYVLSALGLPLLIALLAMHSNEHNAEWQLRPQALWSSREESTPCPQTEPAAATALAEKLRSQAETARERTPFSPEDGTQAVDLFARASACFTAGGQVAEAARLDVTGRELKRNMEQQFHVHQVRLERALVTQRYDLAKTEIRVLMSFSNHRAYEYFNWLSTLDRQIVVKFAGVPQ
ncbi:MAG TPA: FHA domain-containing protein [Polyangiaceae bacterium]